MEAIPPHEPKGVVELLAYFLVRGRAQFVIDDIKQKAIECCFDAENMDPNDWVEKWVVVDGHLAKGAGSSAAKIERLEAEIEKINNAAGLTIATLQADVERLREAVVEVGKMGQNSEGEESQ